MALAVQIVAKVAPYTENIARIPLDKHEEIIAAAGKIYFRMQWRLPFGDDIRRLRELMQLNPHALSVAIGYNENTVTNWEKRVPKDKAQLFRQFFDLK